ncbi:MAG: hypothetical protein ACI814_000693 [Mariniblastus sp.]|jgi:hypothetical protein
MLRQTSGLWPSSGQREPVGRNWHSERLDFVILDHVTVMNQQAQQGHDLIGQPAAPFDLVDTDGAHYRLEDFSGQWLLLVFHRHLG